MNTSEKITLTPAADEKVIPLMVYIPGKLIWGEAIIKEAIRVSTWLRTNVAPEVLALYNAKLLIPSAGAKLKPISHPELSVFVNQIIAYHLIPPPSGTTGLRPHRTKPHYGSGHSLGGHLSI